MKPRLDSAICATSIASDCRTVPSETVELTQIDHSHTLLA